MPIVSRGAITGGLVGVAALGLLAEVRSGPEIFVQLGIGALVALMLLVIYRLFEMFEWAAFEPRPEPEPDDDDDEEEEWIAEDAEEIDDDWD